MKIFAASITDLADTFLHVGYLSAHAGSHQIYRQVVAPSSVELAAIPGGDPTLQASLNEAFQLSADPLGAAAADPGAASSIGAVLGTVASQVGVGAIALTAAMLVLAMAVAWHVWRERTRRPFALSAPAWIPIAVAVSLLWVGLIGLVVAPPSRAADPVDVESAVPAFADPDLATRVILYGLIADGLAGAKYTPYTLSNIDDEIDLPHRDLSEGEAHAVGHFLDDGWGRPFEFAREGSLYTVLSAGGDGALGNGDDITLQVERPEDGSGYRPRAFFTQRVGRETLTLYRAFMGKGFARFLPQRSKALTGSDLFDALPAYRDVEQEAYIRSLTAEDGSMTLLYFEEPAA